MDVRSGEEYVLDPTGYKGIVNRKKQELEPICEAEFLETLANPNKLHELYTLIRHVDFDKTGSVTKNELDDIIKECYPSLESKSLFHLFRPFSMKQNPILINHKKIRQYFDQNVPRLEQRSESASVVSAIGQNPLRKSMPVLSTKSLSSSVAVKSAVHLRALQTESSPNAYSTIADMKRQQRPQSVAQITPLQQKRREELKARLGYSWKAISRKLSDQGTISIKKFDSLCSQTGVHLGHENRHRVRQMYGEKIDFGRMSKELGLHIPRVASRGGS